MCTLKNLINLSVTMIQSTSRGFSVDLRSRSFGNHRNLEAESCQCLWIDCFIVMSTLEMLIELLCDDDAEHIFKTFSDIEILILDHLF